ncbi:hypothetical protein ASU31_10410 [Pedobacter ginsenosidimutans]|uniref:Nucleoside phosphorylase domain-containing protein n=1 Tax=Pedobacter ginsenosidimutans TaxID=687842 RepID=A0A0T5VPY8_9SPHI|nr:hypothetical protein [Pedobacter ginsenosidimutans]KRT15915.1 hypothetical protein ASU31_10410 [Pedobacter ginsenosidimutans]
MSATLSRIPRTKIEVEHFLENNRDEYAQAYKHIRPGEGWRIEWYADEVFGLMDTLYHELYDTLYSKLTDTYSASDQEIIDNIKALAKWAKKENSLFSKITKVNGHGVLVNVEATVQELLVRAYYKMNEAVKLAIEEQKENPKHIEKEKKSSASDEYLIGIITATPEEFNAVNSLLKSPKLLPLLDADSHNYTKGYFEKGTKRLAVVLSQTQDQGSSAAAVATTQMINSHNPNFLVMIGHAAGNKNLMHTTGLGDILVAKEAFDYGQVTVIEKVTNGNIEYIEKDKKRPIEADRSLITRIKQFADHKAPLTTIKQDYPGNSLFTSSLNVHFGSMASGNALVRSESWFNKIITANPGVIGLDMETYGFYFAAVNTRFKNKPLFVSIKSVSDFGSHNTVYTAPLKPPVHRVGYATHTSASFFYEFAMEHLPL